MEPLVRGGWTHLLCCIATSWPNSAERSAGRKQSFPQESSFRKVSVHSSCCKKKKNMLGSLWDRGVFSQVCTQRYWESWLAVSLVRTNPMITDDIFLLCLYKARKAYELPWAYFAKTLWYFWSHDLNILQRPPSHTISGDEDFSRWVWGMGLTQAFPH